jgi:hypothetical protein
VTRPRNEHDGRDAADSSDCLWATPDYSQRAFGGDAFRSWICGRSPNVAQLRITALHGTLRAFVERANKCRSTPLFVNVGAPACMNADVLITRRSRVQIPPLQLAEPPVTGGPPILRRSFGNPDFANPLLNEHPSDFLPIHVVRPRSRLKEPPRRLDRRFDQDRRVSREFSPMVASREEDQHRLDAGSNPAPPHNAKGQLTICPTALKSHAPKPRRCGKIPYPHVRLVRAR